MGIWTPSNTCFLGPTRVHNPNSSSIGSAVFAQFTSECRRACQGMHFPLKTAPYHMGSVPHVIRGFLGPPNSASQTASQLSRFCTAHGRKSLYFTMGASFPQNCPLPWGNLNPHLIHGSLGPSESSSTQIPSWSVQPFLESWLLWQTNRQTNATQSVAIGCICARSTAMQPNSNECIITMQWYVYLLLAVCL